MNLAPPFLRVADMIMDMPADESLLETHLKAPSMTSDESGPLDAVFPLNSLPAEIFLDILCQSIDFDEPYVAPLSQLHTLAQVCVYWWHSICSDPRFWREISREEEEMMDTVLKKNPYGLLFVKCRTWDPTCDCTGFLQVAKQHAHRWLSATFRFERECQMEELRGVYAPLLKTLQIENETWGDDDDVFLPISLPGLEHLDLSNTLMAWGELAGLKYLRLANIPETQLSVKQLVTLLSSSPGLEWLGLENAMDAVEDPEQDASGAASLTLPALRGFEHIPSNQYDQAAQYLHRHLNAPHCYRLVAYIPFAEVIRSGPNFKNLVKIPMEATHLHIAVNYSKGGLKIVVDSPGRGHGIADWPLGPRTPEIYLAISGVPSEQVEWAPLIQMLAIPVEKFGITLRLYQDVPSVDDITFWNLMTQLEIHAGCPHIISVLKHLSEPNIQNGVSLWPSPRLQSIRMSYGPTQREQDRDVPGITQVVIQDGIRDFLIGRSMRFEPGDGVNHDGAQAVPVEVTIVAPPAYLEKLRGNVAEGVQLVEW